MTDWTGPGAAHAYTQAGLRVIPILDKRPLVGGFGSDSPTFTVPWDAFPLGSGVAILLGPCPLGGADRHLLGCDLDGDFTYDALVARVGALPDTLTSKGRRHLYFWTRPDHGMRQWNGLFKTKTGALDIRPNAGGYFLERGDWDGGFSPQRIAPLPDGALVALLKAGQKSSSGGARRHYQEPAQLVTGRWSRQMIEALASIWPRPGQGCHAAALALGGVLADSHWTVDSCLALADRLFELAGVDRRLNEVILSIDTRRSGSDAPVFGWPKLRALMQGSAVTKHHALAAFAKALEHKPT